MVTPLTGALNRGKYDAIYQLTPAFVEQLRTFYGAAPPLLGLGSALGLGLGLGLEAYNLMTRMSCV